MATKLVKNVAAGGIVKVRENGVLVDFVVAKHNYEPELNGEGRTLLVRKNAHSERAYNSSENNEFRKSDLHGWLNGEYKASLADNVHCCIARTNIVCVRGNHDRSTYEYETEVFILSATEYNFSDSDVEAGGTALMVAGLALCTDKYKMPVAHWTRSPAENSSNIYVGVVSIKGDDIYTTVSPTKKYYVRPAFTVLADKTFVLDDGSITCDVASISGVDDDLGEKNEAFSVEYSVETLSGDSATVTESVYGEVIRTYEAESGAEQTAFVAAQKLPDGTHKLEVVAQIGSTAKKRTYGFSKNAFELRTNGSVQEFQDERGDPVFPLTRASAVITEGGKSLQNVLDHPSPVYEVGDIRNTTKNFIGDEWALCNGDVIPLHDYPLLETAFPQGVELNSTKYKNDFFVLETMAEKNHVYGYVDGTAYVLYDSYGNGELTKVTFCKDGGEWETHDLVGLINPPAKTVVDPIKYRNGKYFWLPTVTINNTGGNILYVSDDLITWETKIVSFGNTISKYFTDIQFTPEGGVFALFGDVAGGPSGVSTVYCGYAESLDGEMTVFETGMPVTELDVARDLCAYANGKFFVASSSTSSSTTTSNLWVFDVESKELKKVELKAVGVSSYSSGFGGALYLNGKYFVMWAPYMLVSEDAVEWKAISGLTGQAGQHRIRPVTIAGVPNIVVYSYGSSKAPDGSKYIFDAETLTVKVGVDPPAPMTGKFGNVITENGIRLASWTTKTKTVGSSTVYVKILEVRYYDGLLGVRLPAISADSAYAYIKVKEVEV